MLRTESSHEEGGIRLWGVSTIRFAGDDQGNVTRLDASRVGPPPNFDPIPNTEFSLQVDLVILAMGFTGAEPNGMLEQLGVRLDDCGRVEADDNYMTSAPGIFSAGDMRRGQSLVVWGIAEGRGVARAVDTFLMGSSDLPAPD